MPDTNVHSEFGTTLARLRSQRGLTQPELARPLRVDPSLLSKLERGVKSPTLETATAIDTVLDAGDTLARLARRLHHQRASPIRVPRQLPAAPGALIGRGDDLARLDMAVDSADGTPVVVLDGPAGVGKTALGVQWGHAHHRRFPDGILTAHLHGHDGHTPADPHHVLGDMLTDLGQTNLPADTDSRSRLLRSLLHGRSMLLLLDDAEGADQIRPLLPGSPSTTVLITSRRRLSGLAITGTATRVRLSPLDTADAVELLTRRDTPQRGNTDPDALAAIADGCAGLPLALQAAVQLLADHPREHLSVLAAHLTGPERLRLLGDAACGDTDADLRRRFDASYRRLGAQPARLLRAIGEGNHARITLDQAASLLAGDRDTAETALARLAAESLTTAELDGYHTHSLLRAYAATHTPSTVTASLAA